jgi:hypothetical protein
MKFMNKLQRMLTDTIMLLLLFGILIIPISSVGLLKYDNRTGGDQNIMMEVLSKQDIREATTSVKDIEAVMESTSETTSSSMAK